MNSVGQTNTLEATQIKHWHLDRTVSITHIISTIAVVVSLFAWGGSIDKRIDQNAQTIKHLTELQQRQENRINEVKSEIRSDLKIINGKLDRMMETRIKK
ncbi:hypothetical protein [Spartinivicinus poritis]|uniref:Uncharacterized protein n=1 Tax=Spartinivicinus poritis TaxID=2994640 RepID=A0ABT5UAF5_9GAMM|nr:hypothetical protein [Spartinivicinus sp. A2-2]MDE1463359.1 hypothetical protein [Spartinivicinus sp. A2-2]